MKRKAPDSCLPEGVPETCEVRGRYLDRLNGHPRDSRVYFDAEPHRYYVDFDGDGKFTSEGTMSVTTVVHSFFSEFDADVVINQMMAGPNWHKNKKYRGMTKPEIKALWAQNGLEARENGTKMHAFTDSFYNKEVTLDHITEESDAEFWQFKLLQSDLKGLDVFRTEMFLFTDSVTRVTGSIDALFVNRELMEALWKRDEKPAVLHLVMYDWKRSKKIERFNKFRKGVYPCERMMDANFFHYSLQMNLYKWILEKFYTNAKWNGHVYERIEVDAMFLGVLHPNQTKPMRVQCAHMQREVEEIMRIRAESVACVAAGKPQCFPFDKTQPPTARRQERPPSPAVFDLD